MQETNHLPSYTDFTDALLDFTSDFGTAEIHGLLCGLICASQEIDAEWEKRLLGEKHTRDSRELLHQLYAISYEQMNEFSFEFTLLLPDDSVDISVRTESLGLWCQGFLTGLQQNPALLESNPSSDAKDALMDITEIAQVSYNDLTDTIENETAYLELMEYVRLAALMLYHELNPYNKKGNSDDTND